jgi:hypothetical protein
MLEIVDLFREKGTLDELGIGVVRDAFADHFFPGSSTLHSRARYLLFIPWIYTRLEDQRIPSIQFDRRARVDQGALVRSLVAGGEREGVIGITARDAIIRPPAALYWTALRAMGIRRYAASYEAYVASLDRHYRADRSGLRSDDGELIEAAPRTWHGGLPDAPENLLVRTSFALTRDEADYLRERIVTSQTGTLYAELMADSSSVARVTYPWTHPAVNGLAPELRADVRDAERFSLLIQGAYLLYNLALADASADAGMTAREGLRSHYRDLLARWSAEMELHRGLFRGWSTEDMWRSVAGFKRRVSTPTRRFVDAWATFALGDRRDLADDQNARTLIKERERRLKGSLARLSNHRALELWGEASSTGRLDYRWPNVRRVIADIQVGLRRPDREVTPADNGDA